MSGWFLEGSKGLKAAVSAGKVCTPRIRLPPSLSASRCVRGYGSRRPVQADPDRLTVKPGAARTEIRVQSGATHRAEREPCQPKPGCLSADRGSALAE
jgi:hypothetical protein